MRHRATRGKGVGDFAAFQVGIRAFGRGNLRDFAWRRPCSPYEILIAEVLLQRSRASSVELVYLDLLARWPSAHTLARAPIRSVESVIRPLGLTSRARRLKALAEEVTKLGAVPRDASLLSRLPGVGPYSAKATVAAAYRRRSPTVDGVSARVYRRYFGLPEGRPTVGDRELWDLVEKVTPARGSRTWNWAVLDLAAMVCLPRVPRCGECPLASHCAAARHV